MEPGLHEPFDATLPDAGAIGGEIRAFGHHVEPGKQREPFIEDQIHDRALALLADELQRQQTAQGLLGRDPLGAGKPSRLGHLSEIQGLDQGDKYEQPCHPSAEGAWREVEVAYIGDFGRLRLDARWALLVAPPR